ncbi:methyltransferase family protein [Candidatus Methanoperedens nitroreducens]|uniref:Methyltransferase family protein n=1 Tax=Candidatus Methanoperedens nitratireducens TaxID=1392998 RepID=A0A062V6U1_9EURY|nr:class I SAM-dependent methyltransferase [Candidatus Methanoperedens nitroreducens]KCZ72303.1 methyltransferase family protein [Candidatus Methanoperedens nitroreducens]MDJ1420767.1 class I SAM-dependent methyltransferase [Candidatus Methanoperedens sp.]
MTASKESNVVTLEAIRQYWNEHIHDLKIARHTVGTQGFFKDLEQYRFEKLDYLPKIVDFSRYKGKNILEIGCGVGIDLIRFARMGARVSGVDIAERSIELAKKNFAFNGVDGDLRVMNGEELSFDDNSFDAVYAHGVIQYTAKDEKMIDEIFRVLKPGGEAIIMVYNRYSWLNVMSKLFKTELEHEDAPVLNKYSIWQIQKMLYKFSEVRIIPERFPVKTRLHNGLKANVFNDVFVPLFNVIPRSIVRPVGWHIMVFAYK